MKDCFEREIRYARISVTDRCDLRCRYCMPGGLPCKKNHGEMATLEELAHIARAAAACGVKKFRLTGGEPLVRKGLPTLCRLIRELPGVETLCLTTNGILLSRHARELREAGVDRLNISLDTLQEETFRELTGGDLSRVLEGIRAAAQAGFTGTKINVVLQKGVNEQEIPQLARLARGPVAQVRFIELMPIGDASYYKEKYLPAETVLEHLPGARLMGSEGVAEVYRVPGIEGTVGLIRPMSRKFCDRCDRIRITADGRIRPCLCSSAEYDVRGLSAEETQRRLQEIIRNKPREHGLETEASAGRYMNQIGG